MRVRVRALQVSPSIGLGPRFKGIVLYTVALLTHVGVALDVAAPMFF